ncbi:hypothetical protein BX666DRAFT_1257888 [Dichotomocladium elegans]|nr:hypothetical protein BX666DRAFT_1257888 [Dichotomocladium elegans]
MSPESSSQQQQPNSSDGSLEPFYDQLLKLSFPDSVTAIDQCRDLCAQFGFTVKQEASAHRNIYVFCSREGQPDSMRKKSSPKRKRPSKRCDCRWRVVLYQQNGHWEFRKSLNPEASKHNHELMRPEDIDRNWPPQVIELIYQLARTQLPTADIRARVQAGFPNISWNERRFYNRLSEERQKIKQREAAARAQNLTSIWSRVCMAAAGNEELSNYVESEMNKLFHQTCQMARLDPQSLHAPTIESDDNPATSTSTSTTSTPSASIRPPEPPKGFTPVTIPKYTYYIKMHNQRDMNRPQKRQRTDSTSSKIASTPTTMSMTNVAASAPTTTVPVPAESPSAPAPETTPQPFVYHHYNGMALPTTTTMASYEFHPTYMQQTVSIFDRPPNNPRHTPAQQSPPHPPPPTAAAAEAIRGNHGIYPMYHLPHPHPHQQPRLIMPARTATTNDLLMHRTPQPVIYHSGHSPETPLPGPPQQ